MDEAIAIAQRVAARARAQGDYGLLAETLIAQVGALWRKRDLRQLSELLQKFPKDKDAIVELYLKVHSREPSARELEICSKYLQQAPNRGEGFEDLYWSLINSTEFQTRR